MSCLCTLFLLLFCFQLNTFAFGQIDPSQWNGHGAKVPFVEVEAEHAHHTGHVIGNDRTYGQLSSEASGRRAVQLTEIGQFVEFITPIVANSIVVRYSIPDSADGRGLDATLDLLVDGHRLKELHLTSRYSWYYGKYPPVNDPSAGSPHHFYDEARTLFGAQYPRGTKVRLQVHSLSPVNNYTIDLADFELVAPPKSPPPNSLSVVQFGADPTGKTDSTAAFQRAVTEGQSQRRTVFIPAGVFTLYDHVIVDQVRVEGAGPWHSVLGGRHPTIRSKAVGVFGKDAHDHNGSHSVHLSDFAIIGDITERVDAHSVNGLGGALSHSTVDNLWLQHVKCGAWLVGPMTNFTMRHTRIVDTAADGVNLHVGVVDSTVEHCFVRNTGDDGLAVWASDVVCARLRFDHNTVGLPFLANNIALYGGRELVVSANLVYDTVTNGGGIHVGNRYRNVSGPTAVHGSIHIVNNTLVRAGNSDFNWRLGIGAIWLFAENEEIRADIRVTDTDIIDSSYAALSVATGGTYGLLLDRVRINGTGSYAVQIQSDAGSIELRNVTVHNVRAPAPLFRCSAHTNFTVHSNQSWVTDHSPVCDDLRHEAKPSWPWLW